MTRKKNYPFLLIINNINIVSFNRHWQKEFDERSSANTVVLHGTNEDRDSFVGSEFTGTFNFVYFDLF